MNELETTIERNLDRAMLETIGAGILGETIYYSVTGETLPHTEFFAGFYRGCLEVAPVCILAWRNIFKPFYKR